MTCTLAWHFTTLTVLQLWAITHHRLGIVWHLFLGRHQLFPFMGLSYCPNFQWNSDSLGKWNLSASGGRSAGISVLLFQSVVVIALCGPFLFRLPPIPPALEFQIKNQHHFFSNVFHTCIYKIIFFFPLSPWCNDFLIDSLIIVLLLLFWKTFPGHGVLSFKT